MKKLKDLLNESQHLSYKRLNVGEEKEEIIEASNPVLLWFNKKRSITLLIIGLVLSMNTLLKK